MRRSAPGCLALGTLVTLVVGYAPHQDASWAERTLAAQEIERTGSSCSSFDGEILWANDTYFSEHFECTNSEHCGEEVAASLISCIQEVSSWKKVQTLLLGPFTSMGGFDWWQVMVTSGLKLEGFGQGSAAISAYSTTFRDASTGVPLTLPPIHNHHSSLTWQSPGYESISLPIVFGLANGDMLCNDDPWGVPCLTHDYESKGFVWPLWTDLGANFIWNDVRTADSEPMTWYANISITVVDTTAFTKPVEHLSTLYTHLAPLAAIDGLSRFGTVDVPSSEDSFIIATIPDGWPATGDVIVLEPQTFSYYHSHMDKMHYAFMFAGTPAELGLDGTSFLSSTGCDPVTTASAGFTSAEAMIEHLMGLCPSCFAMTLPPHNDSAASLLCQVNSSAVQVGDYWWDRAGSFECAAGRFRVAKGTPITTLTFWGDKPDQPHAPAEPLTIEGYSPMHSDFRLQFVAEGSNVSYTDVMMQSPSVGEYNETRCVPAAYLFQSYVSPPLVGRTVPS